MSQKYSDMNYVISLLKTNLHFKSNTDRYNLNKRIKKDDMTDITTQLAHLYAISTKANNNVTIINNMYKDDKQDDKDDLLKQIEELKKENKQLKKENEQLKSKKVDKSSDEDSDKVSKKKYDKMIELKNKYWKEANEYKNELVVIKEKNETLQYELDELKKKYNIEEKKPYDPFDEEYSDEEEDEDTYSKIEEVEQKQKEEKEEKFDIHKLDTKEKIEFFEKRVKAFEYKLNTEEDEKKQMKLRKHINNHTIEIDKLKELQKKEIDEYQKQIDILNGKSK